MIPRTSRGQRRPFCWGIPLLSRRSRRGQGRVATRRRRSVCSGGWAEERGSLAMAQVDLGLTQIGFGRTARLDRWWAGPLLTFAALSAFVVYATWSALQGAHYTFGPYLSPFYSPEIFGDSPHSWFGPKPSWWPAWLLFSPALLVLWVPGGFRLTCYYYRGAYYKSFWADPPSCAVGEPRSIYRGEAS